VLLTSDFGIKENLNQALKFKKNLAASYRLLNTLVYWQMGSKPTFVNL